MPDAAFGWLLESKRPSLGLFFTATADRGYLDILSLGMGAHSFRPHLERTARRGDSMSGMARDSAAWRGSTNLLLYGRQQRMNKWVIQCGLWLPDLG